MKRVCLKGDWSSGSQLSELNHVCDLDPCSTLFLVAWVLPKYVIPHTPVKHCNWFCDQGESRETQRECASHGEWWAVGRDSPASEHCEGSVCPWEVPGNLQYPGRDAKGSPTNLLWKQNQYATHRWGHGCSTICLGMDQVDLHSS